MSGPHGEPVIEQSVRQLIETAVGEPLESVVGVTRRGPDPLKGFFPAWTHGLTWRINGFIALGQYVVGFLRLRTRTTFPMAAHLCLGVKDLYAVELRWGPPSVRRIIGSWHITDVEIARRHDLDGFAFDLHVPGRVELLRFTDLMDDDMATMLARWPAREEGEQLPE